MYVKIHDGEGDVISEIAISSAGLKLVRRNFNPSQAAYVDTLKLLGAAFATVLDEIGRDVSDGFREASLSKNDLQHAVQMGVAAATADL